MYMRKRCAHDACTLAPATFQRLLSTCVSAIAFPPKCARDVQSKCARDVQCATACAEHFMKIMLSYSGKCEKNAHDPTLVEGTAPPLPLITMLNLASRSSALQR